MIVYQTENFGNRYDYRSNPHENYVMPPHIHEYSELAFTLSGTTTVIVEGKKYQLPPHHLIFILPNQIHEYRDETDSTMRYAVFSNDHIPAFFDQMHGLQPQNPVINMWEHKHLLKALSATEPNDTIRLCGILNLICDAIIKKSKWIPRSTEQHSMFFDVIQYISQNFREDIQLKDLAKRLGYHEKYLSSSLHTLTGMNFRSFLCSYRINLAKEMLRSKDTASLRVADIALRCGFSSINSFNRVFRENTGMTPTEYRSAQLYQATP